MGSRPGHSIRARQAPAVKRRWNSPRRLGIWAPKRRMSLPVALLKGERKRRCPSILFVLVVFDRSRRQEGRGSYGQ
jgi:hypothetical protein